MLYFYQWRDTVVGQMRFKPDRAAVAEELTAHYEDHVKDLERLGYHHELAEQRALSAMGDPMEIGRALDKAHRPWLGWLWLVSKWSVILCAALLAFFCLLGSFDGLNDDLTPVRREGDYEPEGLHITSGGSPERENPVRIALGNGASTAERAGYTLSIPYAAVWEQLWIDSNTGEPCAQYWYTVVVAADDRRFWDKGPVGIWSMLTAVDDAGRTYDTNWDNEGRNLLPTLTDSDLFRAVYYFYIWSPEAPGKWLEISYPYGEPWSIRVEWEAIA